MRGDLLPARFVVTVAEVLHHNCYRGRTVVLLRWSKGSRPFFLLDGAIPEAGHAHFFIYTRT